MISAYFLLQVDFRVSLEFIPLQISSILNKAIPTTLPENTRGLFCRAPAGYSQISFVCFMRRVGKKGKCFPDKYRCL